MELYCLEEFKDAVEKLSRKKPYSAVEQVILDYYYGKSVEEVKNGTNLNNSDTAPYIKKRLEGSGGFRAYFLVLIRNDSVYLMYIHPKTGPDGSENITDEAKKAFYKKVVACIKADEGLYEVKADNSGKKILFSAKAKSTTIVG